MVKLLIFLLFMFYIFSHPFYCSMILLLISFSILLMLNSFNNWLNYILCMIYLGGILILFMYISPLLPNMKLKISGVLLLFVILFPYIYLKMEFLECNFMLIFYSFFLFKYWVFFIIFMILVLIISSDFLKINISPMRLL